ncbi:hypothetical protein [Pseudorhodoplanes sp.]|uniref:hypothetical protein n=1 Tax=Pseudorhodoplanes sp. TaxID=1934341 RepID=UPI0039190237
MKTRWPWIVPLLSVALAVSPPGLSLLSDLFSTNRLTQGITLYLVAFAVAVALALTLVEWIVRVLVLRDRGTRAE